MVLKWKFLKLKKKKQKKNLRELIKYKFTKKFEIKSDEDKSYFKLLQKFCKSFATNCNVILPIIKY